MALKTFSSYSCMYCEGHTFDVVPGLGVFVDPIYHCQDCGQTNKQHELRSVWNPYNPQHMEEKKKYRVGDCPEMQNAMIGLKHHLSIADFAWIANILNTEDAEAGRALGQVVGEWIREFKHREVVNPEPVFSATKGN